MVNNVCVAPVFSRSGSSVLRFLLIMSCWWKWYCLLACNASTFPRPDFNFFYVPRILIAALMPEITFYFTRLSSASAGVSARKFCLTTPPTFIHFSQSHFWYFIYYFGFAFTLLIFPLSLFLFHFPQSNFYYFLPSFQLLKLSRMFNQFFSQSRRSVLD